MMKFTAAEPSRVLVTPAGKNSFVSAHARLHHLYALDIFPGRNTSTPRYSPREEGEKKWISCAAPAGNELLRYPPCSPANIIDKCKTLQRVELFFKQKLGS